MGAKKNYYNILDVAVDAESKDIRESYIRAKNAYSYNALALYSLIDQNECESMLEDLEEAYMVLSDGKKRKEYDMAHNINAEAAFPVSQDHGENPQETPESQDKRREKSIKDIVTGRKFALNYNLNADFEREMEQVKEFSGKFLKRIREYKNVNIKRMSELTRVSEINIRYIEDEDYTALPALVYVRGFVYQYAKCLRLPPDEVASSYISRLKKIGERKTSF